MRCAARCTWTATGPRRPARSPRRPASTRAQSILHSDVYGWFHRVERGVYGLTPQGAAGLETFADALAALGERDPD